MTPDPPVSLWPDPDALGTVTDLYQLTMVAGYHAAGMSGLSATFEIFVRKLPPNRSFLVLAGLEQAVGDLMRLRISDEEIEDLKRFPTLSGQPESYWSALRSMRFEGDLWSVPEGTVIFPGETIVRVTAPLPQAQWIETFLLASLGYPTLVASKAARMVLAAPGKTLFEFGARRAHGPQAGLLAARSACLAGFQATSHVEAARRLDLTCVGTMAHSWVQSFPSEAESFAAFARAFPKATTLLVDTYDTLEGVREAARLNASVSGVRIDSGDLDSLSRQARAILDEAGRPEIKILGSGDVDVFLWVRLVAIGAPIDGYGIGTELVTSRDAPAISMVYKLVELEGRGRFKLAPGKKTYPMGKQVYRRLDDDGKFAGDLVAMADEPAPDGMKPLLAPILQGGRLVGPYPAFPAIRDHCQAQLASLPDELRKLDSDVAYPITYSDALEAEAIRLMIQAEADEAARP